MFFCQLDQSPELSSSAFLWEGLSSLYPAPQNAAIQVVLLATSLTVKLSLSSLEPVCLGAVPAHG